MLIKMIPTNEIVIEVEPKHAGNYGFFSISGESRSPEDEYSLAQLIESNIKRHIDDVQYTNINQKRIYEDEVGNEYDTLFDLLDNNFNETSHPYRYRYERPSDDGVGSSGSTYNFKELIETAFHHQHNFTVTSENLTDNQLEFINKVIEVGLKSSIKWI